MSLVLQQLQLWLGEQPLFAPISAEVEPGQIFSLMGPSGCGKSSLLAAVIGDLPAAFRLQGDVRWAGESLLAVPMQHRRIGLLHQESLLFPHWSVAGNLGFALPAKLNKAERKLAIEQGLIKAGLQGFADRDISSLSGGQKARISLLRTLFSQPRALLLDEPFSKLDAELRASFRQFVFDLIAEQQIATILVTHDVQDCPSAPLRMG